MEKAKYSLFLENALLLQSSFGIVPLLYGSLGLECLTGDSLGVDDIDILIPRVFLTDRWEEFRKVLTAQGFILTDAHEHTFLYGGTAYSYADLEDLESFARIRTEDIGEREEAGVRFLLLSLEQYLTVYQKSVKDGYRVNVRKKKDAEKIRFIEEKQTDAVPKSSRINGSRKR
ncbi:MAG: hypothetical protein E7658_09250 [Ruminococcaceae bacterium]|nr:hypothetical protein [Oscillospiraceae bacterium]